VPGTFLGAIMKYLLSLLSVCFIVNNTFAYDVATLIADMKARYGQAYAEITDMTLKEESTVKDDATDMTMTMTMYHKGDKWRNETQLGQGEESMTTTTIFDGTDVWSEMMGMKTKLPKDQTDEKKLADEFWLNIPEDAKIAGEESVNGRDCWIVEWNEQSEPRRTWIAKDDLMHVQTVMKSENKTLKIINSDFRKVHKDFMIPYVTEVYSGDKLIMTSLIKEFVYNTGLADDLFDPAKLSGSDNMDLQKLMKQAQEMQKKGEAK
jgi:outer membrane lipoprotein-sorting protein